MSEIRANTVSNAAGTGPVTLTKQSAAKAWVNMNGTGTIAVRDSFNVSSLTDNATGVYTINFSSSMANANYTAPYVAGGGTVNGSDDYSIDTRPVTSSFATASYKVAFVNTSQSAFIDAPIVNLSLHGDLA